MYRKDCVTSFTTQSKECGSRRQPEALRDATAALNIPEQLVLGHCQSPHMKTMLPPIPNEARERGQELIFPGIVSTGSLRGLRCAQGKQPTRS